MAKLNWHDLRGAYNEGYTVPEMARMFHVPKKVIITALKDTGITPEDGRTKTNKSTHCASCQYAGWFNSPSICCNYLLIEGKSRGCQARYCNKYVKGPRIKVEEEGGF